MKRALVLIAEGSEELEAVTVIDLLRRAEVEVVVAGLDDGPITASRGVRLLADVPLDQVKLSDFDLMALPGGNGGTERFEADERVVALVREAARSGIILAAICAAPRVLLRAGVLQGRRVTSYPGAISESDESYAYVKESVVEDGQLITSRGPATAMDFSLCLIERLCGAETRNRVAAGLLA